MNPFRFIGMALFAVIMCVTFASCSNDDVVKNQEPKKITVSLGCVGEILDISKEFMSRTETFNPIYTIEVRSNNMRYAYGTFSSIENLTIDLLDGDTYDFRVVYEPNNITQDATNEFDYQSIGGTLRNGYSTPWYNVSDEYFGLYEGYVPRVNEKIEIEMKRMSLGLNFSANGLDEGATLDIEITRDEPSYGYYDFLELTHESSMNENIYVFDEYDKVYSGIYKSGENKYVNYYESFYLKIILNRVDGIKKEIIKDKAITVERNKKTKIVINIGNSDTTTSNGIKITLEEEEISDGKQYEVDGEKGTIAET